MRIGLTYDLKDDYLALGLAEHEVAEFDSPATIDALEAALAGLGHDVERVGHVRSLAAKLVAGWRCDLVFNIAEGVAGFGRESQVPALLEAYEIPYTFSDPLVCALTLHKGMAKHVARGCGVPTPSFMLVSTVAEAAAVTLPLPLFAKPVAEGSSKGVTAKSLVRSPAALVEICTELLERYRQPVLVEEFLSGREFTVGILGTGDCGAGARDAGGRSPRGRRRRRVLLPQQDGVAEARRVPSARSRPPAAPRSRPWRSRPGAVSVAATRVASTCGSTAPGRRRCSRSTRSPGLTPGYSDLPIMAELAGMSYGALIGEILGSTLARLDAP